MTDESVDLSPVARLYGDSLESHGMTPMGVGWRTEASHDLRFEKLLSVVERPGDSFAINDLGCGYGALHDFLVRRRFAVSRYFGYEISEEMRVAAQARVPAERGTILHADRITHHADFSVASGVFNVKLDAGDEAWSAYAREVVHNLASHSGRGFAFNMLTTYCDHRESHLHYGDPLWWFDWCKREITPHVAVLHDYPLFEWTMVGRVE